jgi:serine/threonine-protein kinase
VAENQEVAAGVREGDVLAGKYRVEKILGAGGMGVVVAAHHIHLDERVAIKFLLPTALASKEAVARFAREARAAAKIKSEHVARVSDVGTLENGAPYMVMEHLDGSDLAAWLHQRGALSVEQAVDFLLQASEAIAEAHAIGIVHRDLKPGNLFVIRRPDGALSVKVLDFGISKTTSLGAITSDITRTSAIMGSPLYMSPEQMQSAKDTDARSDIWALGVILQELLTGELPFMADSMPGLVAQILSTPPVPIREKRPDLPPGLDAVVARCLDRDRGRRFQSVAELAAALLPFAPKRSRLSYERISGVLKAAGLAGTTLATPPSSGDSIAPPPGARTAASWGRTTEIKGKGRWLVLGGLGLAAAVGATVISLRARSTPDPSNASVAAISEPAPSGSPSMVPPNPQAAASGAETVPNAAPSGAAVTPPAQSLPAPSSSAAADRDVDSEVAGRVPKAPWAHHQKPPAAAKSPAQPPVVVVTPVPAAPAASPPPAAAAPHGSTNCNPNYYFDSHGNKHFKPECF